MATAATAKRTKYPTIADVQARLGDVPVERILSFPAPGTATEADLLDNSITGDRNCELIDGILVEKPMGAHESFLAFWIGHLIQLFLDDNNHGFLMGEEGPVRFRVGLIRKPDVAFVRWDRLDDPDDIEERNGAFLEVAPDLAVEVLSPGNTKREMVKKLTEYAKAGVRLVWYVDPDRKDVTVYPRGKERGKKVIGLGGVLDGGDVLPGFTLPVAKIFEKRSPARKGKKGGKR